MLLSAPGAPEFMPMNKEKKNHSLAWKILKTSTEKSNENRKKWSLITDYILCTVTSGKSNVLAWKYDVMDCP